MTSVWADIDESDVSALIGSRVFTLPKSNNLLALHAEARDRSADQAEFVRSTRRIMRLLLEESIGHLRHRDVTVTTPTGYRFTGRRREQQELFAVSIPRAGDALEAELRDLCPQTRFGKILIQRDPVTKTPSMYYTKLPKSLAGREVLLLDPMMATAGTALMAIDVLTSNGVNERDIILVNFLTCPAALTTLAKHRPLVRVVTSFIDEALTPEAYMRPGIGDFGDRFYGTLA